MLAKALAPLSNSATKVAMLLALTLSSAAFAMPGDRSKAIEIESKEALRIEPKGLTVYKGNVAISQGSILIKADKVSVFNNDSKVTQIVCEGNPALFQQKPKADTALVQARGNRIVYKLDSDVIVLTHNASLVQEEATLTGERIEYDLKKEIIRAKGGNGDKRIRMVIPPSQQPEVN